MGDSGLKMRQLRFCTEYVANGGNATQAARVAGYSERTAASIGAENLTKPAIKKRIAQLLKEQEQANQARAEKRGVTKERWLKELEALAFANIDDLIKVESRKIKQGKKGEHFTVETARAVATSERPPELGRAIKRIVPSKDGGVGIELHDKKAALETYGKAMGWVKDEVQMNMPQIESVKVTLTMPSNGREAKEAKKK